MYQVPLLLYCCIAFFVNANCSSVPPSTEDIKKCPYLPKLGVLPGSGWDDLRNIEMAPVTATTYTECKSTIDGKYLIPDHSFVIPVRNSEVSLYSEIVDSWQNYSSLTSRSIGISVSESFLPVRASGSFSYDYQALKQRQVEDKSVTSQVSARYTLYKLGIDPVDNLDPDLLTLFNGAIDALNENDEERSDLIIELIVRDYGTHVVNRIDAGAIVVKEDFLRREFVMSMQSHQETIKAATSLGFFSLLKFDASYQQKISDSFLNAYLKNTTSSKVQTCGGAMYKPGMNISEWIDTIEDNLVSIDRAGDPLFFLITPRAFPNVSVSLVNTLRAKLERVIYLYYSRNGHQGCMNVGSKNFDYNANIENTCDPPSNNYTFGGVYQTCKNPPGFEGDLCSEHGMRQKNIVQGDYSCQFPYSPIVLRNGSLSVVGSTCKSVCYGWWFWKKCENKCTLSNTRITYSGIWCGSLQGVHTNNTGEMFGGLYTSKADNPVTKSRSCPPTFFDVKILQDLHVCMGTDYELGVKYSVPFGGFFSCQNGNPLIDTLKKRVPSTVLGEQETVKLLKTCPNGYTQHTATIEDNCLVNYCVKADSFRMHGEMPVVLPPFKNFTLENQSTWNNLISPSPQADNKETSGIGIAGIAIGFFVAVVIFSVAAFSVFLYRKRRPMRDLLTVTDDGHANGANDDVVNNDSENLLES